MTLNLDSEILALDDIHMPAVIDSITISGKLVLDKKTPRTPRVPLRPLTAGRTPP